MQNENQKTHIREYAQYFYAMAVELYYVMYEGKDTDDLDKILIELKTSIPEFDEDDTMFLDSNVFTSYVWGVRARGVAEHRIVIDNRYISFCTDAGEEKDKHDDYLNLEFLEILEMIYSNEELLEKHPTFVTGEFVDFIKRQSAIPRNNYCHLSVLDYILGPLENSKYFEVVRQNITSLSKLQELKGRNNANLSRHVTRYYNQYCRNISDIYLFYKEIGDNQIMANKFFEMLVKKYKDIIPSNVLKFWYYTPINCTEYVTPPLIVSEQLQYEVLKNMSASERHEVLEFFVNYHDLEKGTNIRWMFDKQLQILSHLDVIAEGDASASKLLSKVKTFVTNVES